ncbi:hypothetical protein Halha_2601 [Halobacteroides halobius DSM 5150]|uniref:Uncharacterized protein n=1 Tax=Halobacteroides halobius (strain ATCC 35273 / DSM 5150 / MD-1) TaxID=748449 RepID=L0KDM5_HALHC|nr:hypothetical protein [Halobacteroides halobius]AGB42474.1 hypothetical protein Halha_2601 [Halobacteroides halobius DSM 5150]
MKNNNKSKLYYVIIILISQSFLLLLVATWRDINVFNIVSNNTLLEIILFTAIILSLISIVLIKELFKMVNREMEYKIQQIKLSEKRKLIRKLREQKHDFSK